MSESISLPSQAQALRLHRQLCDNDGTAPVAVCRAYLDPLLTWIEDKNRRAPPELCEEAVHLALCGYLHDPATYDPERGELASYLRMAAQGDLLNLLGKEQRHQRGRVSLTAVELSPDAGKYLGREDDPSLRLRIAEEQTADDPVRDGCDEGERRVLDLMREGERHTAAYAAALGIGHLSGEEQERQVKRVKDRLKKRLERRDR